MILGFENGEGDTAHAAGCSGIIIHAADCAVLTIRNYPRISEMGVSRIRIPQIGIL